MFKKYFVNLVYVLFCFDYNNGCKCKFVKCLRYFRVILYCDVVFIKINIVIKYI